MTEALSYFCPACQRPVKAFAPGPRGRPGARCPRCNALERHRLVAVILHGLKPAIASSRSILDVAPEPALGGILKSMAQNRYVGLDLFTDRRVTVQADLCRLPFRSGTFDFALCMHVLEHVIDDATAMRELARVVTPGGLVLVQCPRRPNSPTVEDPSASPEERLRRFGQEDHVRYYGRDFEQRLAMHHLVPFEIAADFMLGEAELQRFGIPSTIPIWLCRSDWALHGTREKAR